MSKTSSSLAARVVAVFDRPKFFRFIIVLLVLQAAWIALSGRYPMAFDEDFHLGIIRLYAHHISPFWSGQPENADQFGAVARDPSYLYQYLMSFPYRLISLFTRDQNIQVLILRFIDIGLFAWGLALYRKLLLKTGVSRSLVHFCLLIFVLIPIVPFLAAQINYDNLFLPVTALALLITVNFSASLKKRPDAGLLGWLLTLCLLASLVKYAFLPIFVAIFAFLAVRLWQTYGSPQAILRNLVQALGRLSRRARLALSVALIIAAVLFTQRYAMNLIRYHTPVPDCGRVLTVDQCSEYGPWIRDYNLKLANVGGPRSLRTFTADWFYGMWLRTFFSVGGPNTSFETKGPLPVPGIGAIVFAAIGVLAVALAAPRIFRKYNRPVLWLFVVTVAGYCIALWIDDYGAYRRTGEPVAINGRYLLPVVLPAFVVAAAAVDSILKKKPAFKTALGAVVIVCLAWGGGALTFILRSNSAWYWHDPAVKTVNYDVKRALGPVVPGYRSPAQFLH